MARENNIDLSRVKGTGAGGRITKQDLETYLAQQGARAGQRSAAAAAGTATAAGRAPPAPAAARRPCRRWLRSDRPRRASSR